jgi:hypothetical protein
MAGGGMKKPYFVGEVIGANLSYQTGKIVSGVAGYQMYDVVSVDKSTWQVPKGWDIVIKSRSDGEHHQFYLDGDNLMWDLIQPVEERLWNL